MVARNFVSNPSVFLVSQVFVYLHKNTSLIDTRDRETNERLDFYLNSHKDLNSFWYNLEVICLNTDLGRY